MAMGKSISRCGELRQPHGMCYSAQQSTNIPLRVSSSNGECSATHLLVFTDLSLSRSFSSVSPKDLPLVTLDRFWTWKRLNCKTDYL